MNLTAQSIAALKLGTDEIDRFWFDDSIPGFGIRIRANGTRTWVYQYKIGAEQRRMSLGSVSAIKPAQARAIASELYAKRKLGGDPASERRVSNGLRIPSAPSLRSIWRTRNARCVRGASNKLCDTWKSTPPRCSGFPSM
jgi:hypothetical protein